MRIFNKFPLNSKCPICGSNEDDQYILIPIDNSKKNDGNNMEAIPTHLSCLLNNIRYSKTHGLMGVEANKG